MSEQIFEVDCVDRWQAHHRFRELDIASECRAYQPLKIQIDNPV